MKPTWTTAQNVLCVRLDALGDVLMTTPAMRALKHSLPGRRLTVMTSVGGAAVTPFVPEIDEVIVYDSPWMKATEPRSDSVPEYAMAERLRREGFDAAVVCTVYSQNPLPAAFLCYLAGIPLRLAHCRENPYQLLTHWVPDPEPDRLIRHEVRRQLDLVATVGCQTTNERLSFRVPEAARFAVATLLENLGVALHRPWVVIHPGASAPSRRYPAEGFIETARRLVLEVGCQVLFTGVGTERSLVEEIQAAIGAPTFSLVDQLGVAELAALIARAPLLISNNTAPVHIAAAVGTPVVDLYALTNPQHTPWAVPNRVLFHDVPCKYCYKSICPTGHQECLRGVSATDIVVAARELLDTRRSGTQTSSTESALAKEHSECIPLG
jgi:lipopolysaccharide heptosyltransferase II